MKKAFTLIELLVTISIIAVVSAVGMVAFNKTRASARDARRLADLETIRQALDLYRDDNGGYPISYWVDSNPASLPDPDWISQLVPDYLTKMPIDPLNTGAGPGLGDNGYVYAYWSEDWCNGIRGEEYLLITRLESGGKQASRFGTCSWCGEAACGWYATGEP